MGEARLEDREEGVTSLTDDEAVELGLCYGWISGQRKHYSKVYYLQKYVPRRPRSRWSQVNVAKVEELIRAGRMRPSGWPRSRPPRPTGAGPPPTSRSATPPSQRDLAAALAVSPQAARAFAALSKNQRYAVIQLVTARTATARAAQLRRAMTALEACSAL